MVTADPRGNGRSGRPRGAAAYTDELNAADALAVLDATGTDSAFLVALCSGVRWALLLNELAPERVRGLVAIAPNLAPFAQHPAPFEMVYDEQWRGRYDDWAHYHSELMVPEPHSSKVYDDMVEWALQTDAEVIIDRLHTAERGSELEDAVALVEGLRCPVLVLHGTEDRCQPVERGRRFAELAGARLVRAGGRRPHRDGAAPRAGQHARSRSSSTCTHH